MRAGLPKVVGALVLASVYVLGPVTSASARTRPYLTPGTGRPATTFVLRFRSPDRTGTVGIVRRSDVLTLVGPSHDHGCVARVTMTLGAARQGGHVRVSLNPERHGGAWCSGRFEGTVTEFQDVVCERIRACPDFVIAPRTVFRFSFRVTPSGVGAPAPSSDPTFAGLQSATTCIILPPEVLPVRSASHSYDLSWLSASDPVTPSSAIVYDVYEASSSGGEDYSEPTWTTAAGATTFTTPPLLPGLVFFVVRARDQAGREDQNTIQRPGVSACG